MSQGKIIEKVYGKQKVYMVNQSLFPEVSGAQLKEMEKKIGDLQGSLKEEEDACRTLDARELGLGQCSGL